MEEYKIEVGSAGIVSEDICIDADKGSIALHDTKLDLRAEHLASAVWAYTNVNINNTAGTITGTFTGIHAIGDIRINDSELNVTGKEDGISAKKGSVVLSDNIYVKSPANTKFCEAKIVSSVRKSVLCCADGTPVTKCVIAKKRVSDDICKIAPIPVQNYTGAAILPFVTVTWNGAAMKEGTDYTVIYRNNTNPGTAAAIVTGKGIYSGTKEVAFTIADAMRIGIKVKAGGQEYRLINAAAAAFTKAKNKKSVTVPAAITVNGRKFAVTQIDVKAFRGKKIRTVTIGKNVTKIKANAFKGSPATKLILKTKLLKKKAVKNALKGSKIKSAQVKIGKKSANKKIKKAYKKFFTKKVLGRKITLK